MILEEILIHFYIFPHSLLKDVNFAVYFSLMVVRSLFLHWSPSLITSPAVVDPRLELEDGRRRREKDLVTEKIRITESRASIMQSMVTEERMRTKGRLKKTGYSMPSWRFDRRHDWSCLTGVYVHYVSRGSVVRRRLWRETRMTHRRVGHHHGRVRMSW